MALTQSELARRLRAARVNCGLTQQQVAEALGIPRTAVVQMEAGSRAISSLELVEMARLYGRMVGDFVNDEAFEEDSVVALFRATPGVAEDPVLIEELHKCVKLCREATQLEHLLGLAPKHTLLVNYSLEAPANRWEAILQGRYLAGQERSRLDLGASPIWEIAEIIRRQGVRVAEYKMPENISGLFFHGREIGLVIVVNRGHRRNRRLFSYAHEYCHLLADRDRSGVVSRVENRDELVEVRANAFAAHFLMPEAGVRAFLQTLGKGEETRQVQELYDGAGQVSVQKRMSPGSQDLQVHDVVSLANHFGVSYEAALYHLLNLKFIPKDRFEALREQQETASLIARTFHVAALDEDVHWTLTEQVLAPGFEAYRRGEISRNKLLELAEETGVARRDVAQALKANNIDDKSMHDILPE
ncbi:MAG: XRE family transcriptional regulator [Firmicutes bacterium]|nr:XRE family transcriptional regulator [Bacillota bacterium]